MVQSGQSYELREVYEYFHAPLDIYAGDTFAPAFPSAVTLYYIKVICNEISFQNFQITSQSPLINISLPFLHRKSDNLLSYNSSLNPHKFSLIYVALYFLFTQIKHAHKLECKM